MGLIDRFLNRIKLNDDFDEDDDFSSEDEFEDDFVDDDDDEMDEKPKRGLFGRLTSRSRDDDFDDDPDDDEEEESARESYRSRARTAVPSASAGAGRDVRPRSSQPQTSYASQAPRSTIRERAPRREPERTAKKSKVTPIRRGSKSGMSMEVNVIRPSSMEDTREIADTLMDSCTVVLNLEGLDVDIAQRIIDFTCGCCYALDGSLQKVSSYIFILTPSEVDISGDYQSILSGAFDLPSMKAQY